MYALTAPRVTARHGDIRWFDGVPHWWNATLQCWITLKPSSAVSTHWWDLPT
jgi:hypothetical protein